MKFGLVVALPARIRFRCLPRGLNLEGWSCVAPAADHLRCKVCAGELGSHHAVSQNVETTAHVGELFRLSREQQYRDALTGGITQNLENFGACRRVDTRGRVVKYEDSRPAEAATSPTAPSADCPRSGFAKSVAADGGRDVKVTHEGAATRRPRAAAGANSDEYPAGQHSPQRRACQSRRSGADQRAGVTRPASMASCGVGFFDKGRPLIVIEPVRRGRTPPRSWGSSATPPSTSPATPTISPARRESETSRKKRAAEVFDVEDGFAQLAEWLLRARKAFYSPNPLKNSRPFLSPLDIVGWIDSFDHLRYHTVLVYLASRRRIGD